jgi:hypothetical protein
MQLSALMASSQTWQNAREEFVQHPGSTVNVIKEYDDKLIVAGGFIETENGELVSRIFAWDGATIEHFGCGFTWDCDNLSETSSTERVLDIEVFQDTLYACGNFSASGETILNGIAKWDGEYWLPVDSGFNSFVTDLAVIDNKLHAVGWFTLSGNTQLNGLAVLQDVQWTDPYDVPYLSDSEYDINRFMSILEFQDKLYVGGNFIRSDLGIKDLVVCDEENGWQSVPGWEVGLISFVNKMVLDEDRIILGGSFNKTEEPNAPGNFICAYDGASWDDFDNGLFSEDNPEALNIVYDIHVEGNEVYVCGTPTLIQGRLTSMVAKWNGETWCAFNPDFEFDGYVSALRSICVFEEELYIGGVGHIIQSQDPLNDPEVLNVIVKIDINSADCSLSIGDETLNHNGIEVFPNPCSHMLTIRSDDQIASIHILDALGKEHLQIQNTGLKIMKIPVRDLGAGVYLVKVVSENGYLEVERVVIE